MGFLPIFACIGKNGDSELIFYRKVPDSDETVRRVANRVALDENFDALMDPKRQTRFVITVKGREGRSVSMEERPPSQEPLGDDGEQEEEEEIAIVEEEERVETRPLSHNTATPVEKDESLGEEAKPDEENVPVESEKRKRKRPKRADDPCKEGGVKC